MSHHEAAIEGRTLACGAVASRGPTQRLRALLADRVLSAPDTWERHLIVADLVGAPSDLVDVGGLPGQLARFLPDTRVLAVNVEEPADLIVAADALPFADGAFAAAASLDVLEHVPSEERSRFVREMLRVTRGRSVLCCPLGSPEHRAAEEEIQAWYSTVAGNGHEWLTDHLSKGLPTLEELQSIYAAHGGGVRFLFHGDFRDVNDQFQRLVLARHRHRPADVAGYARFRLSYRPSTDLAGEPSPYSNRVFAVTDAA
jgi:SAM-dependent methyltransferase